MDREKALVKNTIIYAIGNFGSKFIAFFLLPLYTYYLSKSDFGYYDIVLTTTSLLLPIFTLQLNDGMYRYMLTSNSEEEKSVYFTNSVFLVFISSVAGSILFIVINSNMSIKHSYLIMFMFIASLFYNIFNQALRGLNHNLYFSLSGVITTLITIVCNIVMIVILKMKVEALLISSIISFCSVLVFLGLKVKIYRLYRFKYINLSVIKRLLVFSIPLIPNTLMWWIMNLSDRYFLSCFVGMDANGVYAVANKFPSLLLAVNSVFYLAWQESAIVEFKSKDRDQYYTSIFNKLSIFLLSINILLLAYTKLIMRFMVAEGFNEAAYYVPLLYLATIFSTFSTFYGTGYLSSEKTFGAFSTSIIGAAVKVILGLMLIPLIGMQGAALSTLVGFILMWLIRLYQTRKYFCIKIEYKPLLLIFAVNLTFVFIYYCDNIFIEFASMALSPIIFLLFNKKLVKNLPNLHRNHTRL